MFVNTILFFESHLFFSKYFQIWPCLFCIHRGKNWRFFLKIFEKMLIPKSLLNPHFKGFGAITPSRGCRSSFSVHFGIGDVQKAPTGSRFKPIFMFFAIFFDRRLPFFDHFWPFLAFLQQKQTFGHLSAHPPIGLSPISIPSTQNSINFFAGPLFYMAEPQISIFGLCPPYRILTTPYEFKKWVFFGFDRTKNNDLGLIRI